MTRPATAPDAASELYIQRVSVDFTYPVAFTTDALHPDNPALVRALSHDGAHPALSVLPVIDGGVDAAWPHLGEALARYAQATGGALAVRAEPIVVPGGERAKNDESVVRELHRAIHALGLDRHCVVLGIGGGAVLDAVGYAVATAHRGLRMARMPTTVLAQNDAGIGVKTGVNAFGVKNFLGVFAPPHAVINDLRFLATLSARDRAAGMAEAVKVALIRDGAFFHWLEANAAALASFRSGPVAHMVRRAAELHLDHIATAGDPFELGSARPLDFGHWAAHKLEAMTNHALRHGEAVAIGMALDTRLAVDQGRLAAPAGERVCDLLAALRLPTWHEALSRRAAAGHLAVLDGLDEFRQHLGGRLSITLPVEVGRAVEIDCVERSAVERCIDWLCARAESPSPPHV